MKRNIWTILIVLLFWSCSDRIDKNELEQIDSEEIIIDSNKSTNSNFDTLQIEQKTVTDQPCLELQNFVKEIESLGWVSDTNRLNNLEIYGKLNRKNITYFNDKPFYKIAFEDSDLNYFYEYSFVHITIVDDTTEVSKDTNEVYQNDSRGPFEVAFDSVDIELFKNAKSIWAYYYRKQNATEWISDGVIKQWKFENSEEAKLALKQIEFAGSAMYFNTTPFYLQIENNLIIFHTRAMAFSYDQRKLYQILKKTPNKKYKILR